MPSHSDGAPRDTSSGVEGFDGQDCQTRNKDGKQWDFHERLLSESGQKYGYEFLRTDKKVWVLWSPDEQNHAVTLPASALRALNKYGVEVPISSNQITVNSPVYVEFPR